MKPIDSRSGSRSSRSPVDKGAAQEPLALDAFLPYRLSVLANTISNDLARRYSARFGLSIPQWRVMAVLGTEADQSAGEIANRTRMDKVSVSRAVAALRRQGHLQRRTDRADRRRSVLRLTASGRHVYDQIVPLARSYEAELLAMLDSAEREALGGWVEHLDEVALALASESRDE
jgi:DNA-binding MarR family transcriptional regulator